MNEKYSFENLILFYKGLISTIAEINKNKKDSINFGRDLTTDEKNFLQDNWKILGLAKNQIKTLSQKSFNMFLDS